MRRPPAGISGKSSDASGCDSPSRARNALQRMPPDPVVMGMSCGRSRVVLSENEIQNTATGMGRKGAEPNRGVDFPLNLYIYWNFDGCAGWAIQFAAVLFANA